MMSQPSTDQTFSNITKTRVEYIQHELNAFYRSADEIDVLWRAYSRTTPVNFATLVSTLVSGICSSVFFAPPVFIVPALVFSVLTVASGLHLWFSFHVVPENRFRRSVQKCKAFAFKYELPPINHVKHLMYVLQYFLNITDRNALAFHQALAEQNSKITMLYLDNIDLDDEADEEDKLAND